VAGGAADIEVLHGGFGIAVAGKADRQVARIAGAGLLLWVGQKAEAR
jgi:hypothetical protein